MKNTPRWCCNPQPQANFRLDLGTVGAFHEHFASDRASWPAVYRMISGMSVYLPPEILLASNGMAGPNQPDQITMLRCAYAVGNTPMIFNAMLPKSLEELKAADQKLFRRYSDLYRNFIRPIMGKTKVYHHAPVNATGGVESGDWFAMEYSLPDRTRGWATIISLSKDRTSPYLLKPRGLDGLKRYKVTFDNTGETKLIDAATLMREGLQIQPTEQVASELVLFEAE
ncbi:MAG: GH36 C-terminal domain-containing protein [Terriglobia bacterium]